MLRKIRNSRSFRGLCVTVALSVFSQIVYPTASWALTGGPAQPEFNSFTPVGSSDMVDLSSGDMNYNIPLMDVGGYPINLAYTAGIGMDQEASHVGLGWNVSVGQINRSVRGLPDDFAGDQMTYENYMRPNFTVGANFRATPALFGNSLEGILESANISSLGVSATYNNYNGFQMKPNLGMNFQLANNVSVGFNASSGPDGLSISPNASLHGKWKHKKNGMTKLGASFGVSMNSRQGLQATTLSMTKKGIEKQMSREEARSKERASSSIGSTISFTDPLYTPNKRVGMSSQAFTVNAALGAEFYGAEGQGQITAFGTVNSVAQEELQKSLPAYGYSNTEKASTDGVLDFNREKDGNFSVNSTNMPVTNYTYDIYSVQGQGISGTFRPYRNQVGFVFDPNVKDGSVSGTLGLEFGSGNAFHFGADFEATIVNGESGNWQLGNNMIPYLKHSGAYVPDYERVHYKNVGDLSADNDFGQMFSQTGQFEATRVAWNVNGMKFNRIAQNIFKKKINGEGNETPISVGSKIARTQRLNRNQAIINVTKADLLRGVGYGPCVDRDGAGSGTPEITLPSQAKDHHTAEVQIVRNDGARYVYGLPAYNLTKKEATFAVENNGDCTTGLVSYTPSHLTSPSNLPGDQFLDRTTTPGYAHTHLLTSVLSVDYQDRTNNGPTNDDFGSYTKFSYKSYAQMTGSETSYKWRVPFDANKATYNEGLRTDADDQRGNYVYGEKEMYYVDKIETKTHIAIFSYTKRKDAFGVLGESGGLNTNAPSYKLDKIELYSIEEHGQTGAKPIKTVHFVYDYSLCQGVPNNPAGGTLADNELADQGGKLTLKCVYFTYRDSKMGKYTDYEFTYSTTNPNYDIKGYDSWGNYLPNNGGCGNSDTLTASEFPFTSQDKTTQDSRAQAWSLTEIKLPSGGKITVTYESDDYQYVQDKHTMKMFKVAGVGFSPTGSGSDIDGTTGELYGDQLLNKPKTYVYVEVDASESTSLTFDQIKAKYFKDDLLNQPIYFRFFTNMTQLGYTHTNAGKFDFVTGYFEYEEVNSNAQDDRYNGDSKIFAHNGKKYLSIPVKLIQKEGGLINSTGLANEVNPIAKASWNFGRKYLNKHVYSNQLNGAVSTTGDLGTQIQQAVNDLVSPSIFNNLVEIFTGSNATLENRNIGRKFVKQRSWVRLSNPTGAKLGGGCRVKEIKTSDVWGDMTNDTGTYQTKNYGQKYEYTLADGSSSGVATYEPVGNKENPFVQPVFSTTKHLLAPDEENYVEKPFGESFFPSPQVTYSKVRVTRLAGGEAPGGNYQVKKLHRTGSVVTEFYTSKDYPTIVDQTIMEAKEDKNEALASLLNLHIRRHFTASQGYTIHLNDMNGKQKAQWVYAEGQDTPISGVEYLYENHTTPSNFNASSQPGRMKGRLNNEVVVIHPDGTVGRETIGVEVDVVNDFRYNSTVTQVPGINANLATFFVGIIPGIVPVPLPDYSYSEEVFKSVSTTKVINTFGILKETIAYDAGASVSTKNLAWDAATGEVLLTETVDEYNDHYYTLNYPAHWYYKGMAQASNNIGLKQEFTQVTSGVYKLTLPNGYTSSDFVINGDEVILTNNQKLWVTDVAGNQFKLIDVSGTAITGASGELMVIRSGHRNLQSAGIMNVTLMRNPLLDSGGNLVSSINSSFLTASQGNWSDWKIINAGAVDYSDDWDPPCECGIDLTTGTFNPYAMNARGVWRTKSSRTYLGGRNKQTEVTPRQQGFFLSFNPMYKQTTYGSWMKDFNNWTFVAEVTNFNPYGFEMENRDALSRHSAAQYGYNHTFPMAVGANTRYSEIGYDGFEDYAFNGCDTSAHFKVGENLPGTASVVNTQFHSGKHSLRVGVNSQVTMTKKIECQ